MRPPNFFIADLILLLSQDFDDMTVAARRLGPSSAASSSEPASMKNRSGSFGCLGILSRHGDSFKAWVAGSNPAALTIQFNNLEGVVFSDGAQSAHTSFV